MGLIEMSSEQKLIKSEVKKFTNAELEPIASDIEKDCRLPSEILKKLAQMGLFGLTIPEKYGGSGLDALSLSIALEEFSKSCASLGLILAVNNCIVANLLTRYGSPQIKEEYLKRISQGGIGGYGLYSDTEIAGKTNALITEKDNHHFSGRIDLVLNGGAADFCIIPVKSERGIALQLVNRDAAGINYVPVETMGMRSAGITSLEFQGVKLGIESCLVGEDDGLEAIQRAHDFAHIGYAAIALGLTEASLEASIKYAKERRQFGRAISEFPMIQDMLAEIKICIEESRLLVYDAAHRFDKDEGYGMIVRIACLTSCGGAVSAALKAIQIHGGYGYTKDYPVERYFRDAKSIQLLGESPVDLRTKIAKELLV